MTLSRRLLLTLSVALLALFFVGGIGLWRLNQAQQRFEYVQANILPSIKELNDIKYDIVSLVRDNYRYLLSTDDASKATAEQAIDTVEKSSINISQHTNATTSRTTPSARCSKPIRRISPPFGLPHKASR
jgi:CHASE3 domain sensor protein